MDKEELLRHLANIHGVELQSVEEIDPELVRSFLNHENERVAGNAVFLARLYPPETAVPIFEEALENDHEMVALAAAAFAIHLDDEAAKKVLRQALTKSSSPSVLRAALRAASTLQATELLPVMKDAFEKLPDGGFKKSCEGYLDLGN